MRASITPERSWPQGVVALLSFSLEMLVRCGLGASEARRVLLPLVEGTVANVAASAPNERLRVRRRGDSGTIARNLVGTWTVDSNAADLYRVTRPTGSRHGGTA